MANKGGLWSYHQGRWNITKLVLRSISLVLGFALVGVSVPDALLVSEWSGYNSYPTPDWWFILPIIIVSTGLDCAELASSIVWKRNPGLHPGCHIAGELVILGGNLVAFSFISPSVDISTTWYYDSTFPRAVGPLKAALIAFLGLFTADRFILFVIACVDTHRHHATAQVELIVKALRQHNIGDHNIRDPATAEIIHNSLYPPSHPNNRQPVPVHEFPPKTRPVHEPGDDAIFYRELPDNQKFLGSLHSNLK
ncbi:hypothetical protein F5X97DRAFT_283165 [Nemania serpens]|nr:hypothetical protein F5X97DRAFT_283165 [Nemania serpens]